MVKFGSQSARTGSGGPRAPRVSRLRKLAISALGSVVIAYAIHQTADVFAEKLLPWYASVELKYDEFNGTGSDKKNIIITTIDECAKPTLESCFSDEFEWSAIVLASKLSSEIHGRSSVQKDAGIDGMSGQARTLRKAQFHSMAFQLVTEAKRCGENVRSELPNWTTSASSSDFRRKQPIDPIIPSPPVSFPNDLGECTYLLEIVKYFVIKHNNMQDSSIKLPNYSTVKAQIEKLHNIFSGVQSALKLSPELLLAYAMGGSLRSSAERFRDKGYCNLFASEDSECRQMAQAFINKSANSKSMAEHSHSWETPRERFKYAVKEYYRADLKRWIIIILSLFSIATWPVALDAILNQASVQS